MSSSVLGCRLALVLNSSPKTLVALTLTDFFLRPVSLLFTGKCSSLGLNSAPLELIRRTDLPGSPAPTAAQRRLATDLANGLPLPRSFIKRVKKSPFTQSSLGSSTPLPIQASASPSVLGQPSQPALPSSSTERTPPSRPFFNLPLPVDLTSTDAQACPSAPQRHGPRHPFSTDLLRLVASLSSSKSLQG